MITFAGWHNPTELVVDEVHGASDMGDDRSRVAIGAGRGERSRGLTNDMTALPSGVPKDSTVSNTSAARYS